MRLRLTFTVNLLVLLLGLRSAPLHASVFCAIPASQEGAAECVPADLQTAVTAVSNERTRAAGWAEVARYLWLDGRAAEAASAADEAVAASRAAGAWQASYYLNRVLYREAAGELSAAGKAILDDSGLLLPARSQIEISWLKVELALALGDAKSALAGIEETEQLLTAYSAEYASVFESDSDRKRAEAATLALKARFWELEERPDDAIAAGREAIRRDPLQWDALVVLTNALMQQDRLGEAIDTLTAALNDLPDLPDGCCRSPRLEILHYNLGNMLMRRNEPARAADAFERARKIVRARAIRHAEAVAPVLARVPSGLSSLLLASTRPQYASFPEAANNHADALLHLLESGSVANRDQALATTEAALHEALASDALEPQRHVILFNLGRLRTLQNRPLEAIRQFHLALLLKDTYLDPIGSLTELAAGRDPRVAAEAVHTLLDAAAAPLLRRQRKGQFAKWSDIEERLQRFGDRSSACALGRLHLQAGNLSQADAAFDACERTNVWHGLGKARVALARGGESANDAGEWLEAAVGVSTTTNEALWRYTASIEARWLHAQFRLQHKLPEYWGGKQAKDMEEVLESLPRRAPVFLTCAGPGPCRIRLEPDAQLFWTDIQVGGVTAPLDPVSGEYVAQGLEPGLHLIRASEGAARVSALLWAAAATPPSEVAEVILDRQFDRVVEQVTVTISPGVIAPERIESLPLNGRTFLLTDGATYTSSSPEIDLAELAVQLSSRVKPTTDFGSLMTGTLSDLLDPSESEDQLLRPAEWSGRVGLGFGAADRHPDASSTDRQQQASWMLGGPLHGESLSFFFRAENERVDALLPGDLTTERRNRNLEVKLTWTNARVISRASLSSSRFSGTEAVSINRDQASWREAEDRSDSAKANLTWIPTSSHILEMAITGRRGSTVGVPFGTGDEVLDEQGLWGEGGFHYSRQAHRLDAEIGGSAFIGGVFVEAGGSAWGERLERSQNHGNRDATIFAGSNIGAPHPVVRLWRPIDQSVDLSHIDGLLRADRRGTRMDVAVGARWVAERSRTRAIELDANPVSPAAVPGIAADAQDGPRWSDVLPWVRLGLDVFSNGRWKMYLAGGRDTSTLGMDALVWDHPSRVAYADFALRGFFAEESLSPLRGHGITLGSGASPNRIAPRLKPELTTVAEWAFSFSATPRLTFGARLARSVRTRVLEARPFVTDGSIVRTALRSDYELDPAGLQPGTPLFRLKAPYRFTGGELLLNGDRKVIHDAATAEVRWTGTPAGSFLLTGTYQRPRWVIGDAFALHDDPTPAVIRQDTGGVWTTDRVGEPFGVMSGADARSATLLQRGWSVALNWNDEFAWPIVGHLFAGVVCIAQQGLPRQHYAALLSSDGTLRDVALVSAANSRYPDLYDVNAFMEKRVPLAQGVTLRISAYGTNLLGHSATTRELVQTNSPRAGIREETQYARAARVVAAVEW